MERLHRNRENLGMTPTQLERMDTYGRRIMLEAKLGRADVAKGLVDQFIDEERASDDRSLESVRLAEVLSDQLVVNMLDREFSCLSVGDLLGLMPQVLLATPLLGETRVAVVYQELAKYVVRKCIVQERELLVYRHQNSANGKIPAAV